MRPVKTTIAPEHVIPTRDAASVTVLPPGAATLITATMVMLAAPVALFFLGWLRAPWSWLSTAAIVWSTAVSIRRLRGASVRLSSDQAPERAGRVEWFASAGVLLVMVALSGAGGVGDQTWDWEKHNAVLADLVRQPWPVAYRLDASGETMGLVYYFAYHLPAAVVGKVFGWRAANAFLFGWTALGALLSWRWIARLGHARPVVAAVVFALFSGFDLLSVIAPSGAEGSSAFWWQRFDLEWWHGQFVYPGNVTLIAFAPNQALGGWLATALSLDALRRGVRGFPLVAPMTLCLLWSPMAAAGLVALVVVFLLTRARCVGRLAPPSFVRRQLSTVSLVMSCAVTLPLVLYFAAHLVPPSLTPDLQPPLAAREVARLRFLPAALGVERFAVTWVRFLAIEVLPTVAVLGAAIWLARRYSPGSDRFGGRLLVSASIVLAALPLVAYGFYNDWAMRASIPALFALQVIATRALSRMSTPAWGRRVLAACLLVAGLYPLAQLRIQAARILYRQDWIYIVPRDQVPDLFQMQRTRTPFYGFLEQYVASERAPFFRYLAAPLEARSIGEPEVRPEQGEPVEGSAGATRSN